MQRRARAIVFWPGMTNDIHRIRNSCVYCNRNSSSQAAPPPMLSEPPATPFEKNFADYFDYWGRHFLVIGDRFSGWADVFGTPLGSSISRASALTHLLRSYFSTFRVPKKISTNFLPLLPNVFSKLGASTIECQVATSHSLKGMRKLPLKPPRGYTWQM